MPLDLEVWWATISGCYHHFHWRFRGRRVFVSVNQNNNNTLHTNPNFKIVQDGKNIMYAMILLKNKTKVTYNENLPIYKSQKTTGTEFEDLHLYRAELVQNIPKNWIYDNSYWTEAVGRLNYFNVNILAISI